MGITLVVATGLPMGREGPMVHTGAIASARPCQRPKPRLRPDLTLRLTLPERPALSHAPSRTSGGFCCTRLCYAVLRDLAQWAAFTGLLKAPRRPSHALRWSGAPIGG